jgi:hypothetical protein
LVGASSATLSVLQEARKRLFVSRLLASRATLISLILSIKESPLILANSAKALETCREFKGNWRLSRSRYRA